MWGYIIVGVAGAAAVVYGVLENKKLRIGDTAIVPASTLSGVTGQALPTEVSQILGNQPVNVLVTRILGRQSTSAGSSGIKAEGITQPAGITVQFPTSLVTSALRNGKLFKPS